MPDHPADWRRALELLASSPEGATEALLMAHGFESTVIAGLVESGLATLTTEVVLAGRRPVDVRRLRLSDSGRKALGQ
jgi:hypothetical protein